MSLEFALLRQAFATLDATCDRCGSRGASVETAEQAERETGYVAARRLCQACRPSAPTYDRRCVCCGAVRDDVMVRGGDLIYAAYCRPCHADPCFNDGEPCDHGQKERGV